MLLGFYLLFNRTLVLLFASLAPLSVAFTELIFHNWLIPVCDDICCGGNLLGVEPLYAVLSDMSHLHLSSVSRSLMKSFSAIRLSQAQPFHVRFRMPVQVSCSAAR